VAGVVVDIEEDDMRPGLCKRHGGRPADTGGGTGNGDNTVGVVVDDVHPVAGSRRARGSPTLLPRHRCVPIMNKMHCV
jgi:hypothetical protein